MSVKLKELIENIEFNEIVGNGEVASIIHNEKENSLLLQLKMSEIPDADDILNADEKIRQELSLSNAEIYPMYSSDFFNAGIIPHVIKLIKSKAGVINGFLTDIDIRNENESYFIMLKNGGKDILSHQHIDREIEK